MHITLQDRRPAPSPSWRIGFPLAVSFVLLTLIAFRFLDPPCPTRLVIASGSSEGSYFGFAKQYAEVLARHGIELEVIQTQGSADNLARLRDPSSGVSVAIVQGGLETPRDSQTLSSLGSLYLEPLWVFYRHETTIARLSELRGARIAVGAPGSGTHGLAMQLIEANGMLDADSETADVACVQIGGSKAADALIAGDVHAACFVVSPRADLIRKLLDIDGIRVMSFRRAEACARQLPFLSRVTLPEGALDLDRNLPHRDIDLVAANANLVVRSEIHSAVIPLLIEAAREVHSAGGSLESPDEYPSPHHASLPLSGEARRYYMAGPSLLYRVAPFRVAAWLDRMKVLLLPLITLLVPLVKAVPPLVRWRIRQRIYCWYRVLQSVDDRLRTADARTDLSEELTRLEQLEDELTAVSVPLSYMEEFYNLRLHVSFMTDRLRSRNTHKPALLSRAA